MKGLLRKDFYMMWAYTRIFLLMLAIFLAVSCFGKEDNVFFTIYPMIIGMVLPVSLLSYDERFHWNRSCDAMPCSRAQVVSAKYLLTLMMVLLIFVLTMLGQGVRLSRLGRLAELTELVPLLLGLGLVGPGLLMPVLFWLGVEKGRLAYYIAVGVVVAVGVFLGTGSGGGPVLAFGSGASFWASAAVSVLVFALSWLLSIKLYEKRDL